MANDAKHSPGLHLREAHELSRHLDPRLEELEHTIVGRIRTCGLTQQRHDFVFVHGIRKAVRAAVRYGLAAALADRGQEPEIPLTLLMQARQAAREEVGLGAVLRSYNAGYHQLVAWVMDELREEEAPNSAEVTRLLARLMRAMERLMEAIETEYELERKPRVPTHEQRLADRISRSLAGELIDVSDLHYDTGSHHVGVVTRGHGVASALGQIARTLDGCLLLTRPRADLVWAWIGTPRPLALRRLDEALDCSWPSGIPLALGEPCEGLGGWRLTHQQAVHAFPYSLHPHPAVVRYSQIALISAIEKDEVANLSIRQLFLQPLCHEKARSSVLRITLETYLRTDRNISSAAAALGVHRRTVRHRLDQVEEKLGRSLATIGPEMEVALRLR